MYASMCIDKPRSSDENTVHNMYFRNWSSLTVGWGYRIFEQFNRSVKPKWHSDDVLTREYMLKVLPEVLEMNLNQRQTAKLFTNVRSALSAFTTSRCQTFAEAYPTDSVACSWAEELLVRLSHKKVPTYAILEKLMQLDWSSPVKRKACLVPRLYSAQLRETIRQMQKDYDVIMVDEAQDLNECNFDLMQMQQCPKIIVADAHQAIYQFRNAHGIPAWFKPTYTMPLRQSFRFGAEIASAAQLVLSLNGERNRILGSPLPTKRGVLCELDTAPAGLGYTVLARSNRGAFLAAIDECMDDKPIRFVSDRPDPYTGQITHVRSGAIYRMIEQLRSVDELRRCLSIPRFAADLGITSYQELVKYAKDEQDVGLLSIISLIEHCTARQLDVPALIESFHTGIERGAALPDSEVVTVSTVHNAKGREWLAVKLADDFKLEKTEDINILYVAVTRAKRMLEPNPVLRYAVFCLLRIDNETDLYVIVICFSNAVGGTSGP